MINSVIGWRQRRNVAPGTLLKVSNENLNNRIVEKFKVKALQKYHDQLNLLDNFLSNDIHLLIIGKAIAKQFTNTVEGIPNKNTHLKADHQRLIKTTEWAFLK